MEGEKGTGQEAPQTEVQDGRSSAGEKSSPSTQPTHTEEQVRKIQAGLDKQVHQLKGLTEKQAEALKLSDERARQLQSEIDELEKQGIGDDPDALSEHRRKKAWREKEAEFDKRVAEFDKKEESNAEALADLEKAKRIEQAEEIASRHNVDTNLVLKYGGEDMEAFAKDLPKLSEDKRRPDSGMTSGGGIGWRDLSADDKIRKGLSK